MKLKFTEKRGFSILEVSEAVSAHESALLHAGVEKTLKAKKEPLILDLTACIPTVEAIPRLARLQMIAVEMSADLIVVCSDDRDARVAQLAQFRTLQEAVHLMVSG